MNKRPDQEKLQMQEERAYDKSRQFNNLDHGAYNHGLQRETWCTVEKSSNTAHMRVNMENLKYFEQTTYVGKQARPERPVRPWSSYSARQKCPSISRTSKRPMSSGYGQSPRAPCTGPPGTRKHFHQANQSTVFDEQRKDSSRMSGMMANSVGIHAEKRHYPTRSNVSQQQQLNTSNNN